MISVTASSPMPAPNTGALGPRYSALETLRSKAGEALAEAYPDAVFMFDQDTGLGTEALIARFIVGLGQARGIASTVTVFHPIVPREIGADLCRNDDIVTS